ncbi:hypothetical protein V1477_013248 [Vespula maculifrons]|uniref:Uncharacterized protein n=1 Tax=Vespula maculifrons TaxID=7453 RepID=A0ABD2BVW3_VESMC
MVERTLGTLGTLHEQSKRRKMFIIENHCQRRRTCNWRDIHKRNEVSVVTMKKYELISIFGK